MIITLMNQKRGLNRFSKLPDDRDPWLPNNLLKPGAKEKLWPQPTKMNTAPFHKYSTYRFVS